jgi:hypothetical protein
VKPKSGVSQGFFNRLLWHTEAEQPMDILKMLEELRTERRAVEEAILVMERLAAGTRGKRRGRPPKWLAGAKSATEAVEPPATEADVPKKKRSMSAAARKRISEAQKKRWAGKKAEAK